MKLRPHLARAAALLAILTLPAAAQFVTVGNPGNPNDPSDGDSFTPGVQNYGAVGYTYAIGTYEVTLNQYTAFLNAVAATDTFELYSPNMATDLNSAGISRANSPGSYAYTVIGDGQRPVTYVTFFDAVRYANWLHNGGGAGSTETGAYTLLGGTPTPSNGTTMTRNGGAQVWIPSDNKWYKAAYYDPSVSGPVDDYWLHPTQSDADPNSRNGSVSDANSGNFRRDGGLANGFNDGYAVSGSTSFPSGNALTPVGAYTQADSYYGTFDQGGNVRELNYTLSGVLRGLRGSSWNSVEVSSSSLGMVGPAFMGSSDIGFRVATVPEPERGDQLAVDRRVVTDVAEETLCALALFRS